MSNLAPSGIYDILGLIGFFISIITAFNFAKQNFNLVILDIEDEINDIKYKSNLLYKEQLCEYYKLLPIEENIPILIFKLNKSLLKIKKYKIYYGFKIWVYSSILSHDIINIGDFPYNSKCARFG